MRILSFDSSTSAVHLSLLQGRETVDEQVFGDNLSDRKDIGAVLMPEIDRALKRSKWSKNEIDLVVVGVGPGSFTGIRVSIITARTLAQVLRVGLIGVSTLESQFYASNEPDAAVVISTTSNQFFYGGFRRTPGGDPAAVSVEPGCGPATTVQEALAAVPVWLSDEKFSSVDSSNPVRELPATKNVATIQAQVAVDRLSLKALIGEGNLDREAVAETFPWHKVLPLYLRSPSVTIKKSYAT